MAASLRWACANDAASVCLRQAWGVMPSTICPVHMHHPSIPAAMPAGPPHSFAWAGVAALLCSMLQAGTLHIVMEYADQGELSHAVQRAAAEKVPFHEDQIMLWCALVQNPGIVAFWLLCISSRSRAAVRATASCAGCWPDGHSICTSTTAL